MNESLNVLCIGEVLWDVINNEKHLGGAPLNVAAHLSQLGHHASIYSAVGDDDHGGEIELSLLRVGVDHQFLQKNTHPTSTVDVFLEDGQPDYRIHENVAWDYLTIDSTISKALETETWDVAIFGLLSQRRKENAEVIYQVIEAANAHQVFLDVNIRKDYYSLEKLEKSLGLSTILKLNEDELGLIRDLFYPKESELRFAAEKLSNKFNIQTLLVTLGEEGAWAYHNRKWFKAKSQPVDVADAIGAGDSFSAAFIHAFSKSRDVQTSLECAVEMGGYVASQHGAIPKYNEHISSLMGLGTR